MPVPASFDTHTVRYISTGLEALLGMRFVAASCEGVALTWTVTPLLLAPNGRLHHGVISAAIESAASTAAGLWLGDHGRVVGVSNTVDHFVGVSEGDLVATSTAVFRDQHEQVWDVTVTDHNRGIIARGSVRLQNITSSRRYESVHTNRFGMKTNQQPERS